MIPQFADLPFPPSMKAIAHKHTQPRRTFTSEEDRTLRGLVSEFGISCWGTIAQCMPGRTARQCRDRYKNYLLDSLTPVPWTKEDDAKIRQKYVELGPKWVEIAKHLPGRSGNSVKNRWNRHIAKEIPRRVFPSLAALPHPPQMLPIVPTLPPSSQFFPRENKGPPEPQAKGAPPGPFFHLRSGEAPQSGS
jgi:hypothetical protein